MKLHVAHIITRMIPGGASQIVGDLINPADDRFLTTLITGPEGLPEGIADQFPNVRVHVVQTLRRDIAPITDMRCLLQLTSLIRREKFDIVHTHTSKSGFLGRAAARIAGSVRNIHTPHGTIHLPGSNIPGIPDSRPIQKTLLCLERLAGRWTHALVTLSNSEKAHFIALKISNDTNTHVVYNGIDLNLYAYSADKRKAMRREFNLKEDAIVLLSAGRLTAEKRHDILIQSFLQLSNDFPNIYLMIAGSGPQRDEMEATIKKDGDLDGVRVIFPGHVDDIPALLSAADIFVLPSMYEGFGLAALEAMAAGRPVVASDVGGLPELIDDGTSGYLFAPGDPSDLTVKLTPLIQDKTLRESIGAAALKRSGRFTTASMRDAYFKLYLGINAE